MAQNRPRGNEIKPKNIKYGVIGFSLTKTTFVILAMFLALALTAFGILMLYINEVKDVDLSDDYMGLGAFIFVLAYGLLLYVVVMLIVLGTTVISILSFVGFIFGITSIKHQTTKRKTVILRTLTYLLLTVFLISFVFAVYLWCQPEYGGLTWSTIKSLFSLYLQKIFDKIISVF